MIKRDPEREERLRQVIEEWERSGKTAREFCCDRELNAHTLYGWRREIRRQDGESKSSGTSKRRRRFVQVEVAASSCLELSLGGDLVLRVPPSVNGDRLTEILIAARKSIGC